MISVLYSNIYHISRPIYRADLSKDRYNIDDKIMECLQNMWDGMIVGVADQTDQRSGRLRDRADRKIGEIRQGKGIEQIKKGAKKG